MDNKKCEAVLVVEDDRDIRESVQQILEFDGHKVYTAANGQEALLLLNRITEPCLILLDLMMPVMNGWQFLEARRKNHVISDLPVIVVSAVADEKLELDDHTCFVRKPPDVDALLKLVNAFDPPVSTPSRVAC